MPDYLKTYTDEQIKAGEATKAVLSYVSAIERKAKAEATAKKLAEIDGKISDIDTDIKGGYKNSSTLSERLLAGFSQGNTMSTADAWKKQKEKEKAELVAQQKEIREMLVAETLKTMETANDLPLPEVKSLDALRAKLEEVTKARGKAVYESKEFFRLDAEMNRLQKEIDKYAPKTKNKQESEASRLKREAVTEFEKLGKEYKKLNLQRLNDLESDNQKELKQEADKYDALIENEKDFLKLKGRTPEQEKETKAAIKTISSDKKAAIDALTLRQEQKMFTEISSLRTRLTDLHETELQKQKDQINKFYDDLVRANVGNAERITQINAERAIELGNAEIREKERLEKDKEAIAAQYDSLNGNKPKARLAAIKKQYDDEVIALKLKYSQSLLATKEFQEALALIEKNRQAATKAEEKAQAAEKKDLILQSTQAVADAAFQIGANNRAAESAAALDTIEKNRNEELSKKNLTEAQKKKINEKYDAQARAEKLKAWEADRRAALAQAVIAGALAVVKALPNVGQAIAAGVAAAANIAVIASEPTPKFAGGGYSSDDPEGYVGQATLFKKSASGRPFIAGEAGKEWIAPNWMVKSPRFANVIGMLESARKEKRAFANGGYNSDFTPGQSPASIHPTDNRIVRLESLVEAFIIEQQRFNRLPVVNDWAVTEDYLKKLDNDKATVDSV
ncbi:MAG: hypothetical protein EOP48_13370, partial [Sphingobacteriales bacterium]